jgi:hypothetical protein
MIENEQSKSDISLLTEETGCSEDEARLALSLSANNLKDAFLKASALSKIISVFKVKVLFPKDNIYGLMFIAINKKSFSIVRFNLVFSQNPAVYEVSAESDWFSFEKSVFASRLLSGVMEDYTKAIEIEIKSFLENQLSGYKFSPSLIEDFFKPLEARTEIAEELLNMSDFKKIRNGKEKSGETAPENYKQANIFQVEAQIENNAVGKPAYKIKKGDAVFSTISDKREIAQYVKALLDSNKKNMDSRSRSAIAGTIRQIKESEDCYDFYIQYAPRILGCARVKKDEKIKMVSKPFLEKIAEFFKELFSQKFKD